MNIDPADIERLWPLSGVTIGERFEAYPTRTVLRVDANEGSFVAKTGGEGHALRYLNERGFRHAPTVLQTRSREDSAGIGSDRILLLEFIPRPVAKERLLDESWHELGAVAAKLNAYDSCPTTYAIPTTAALTEIAAWAEGRAFETELLSLLARIQDDLQSISADGLIHGEINEANAGRREDGTPVLLDWDDTGMGPTCIELGYPLVTVFLAEGSHELHASAANSFYRGYAEAGGRINPEEVFAAALLHALRYVRYGDVQARWERVRYAASIEADLREVIAADVASFDP